MSQCQVLYAVDEYRGVPKCPNCGKFLKWHGWDKGFTCVCNGIINLRGNGDEEEDEAWDEESMRICKKPEGWVGGIFFEDTDPLYWKGGDI